MKTVKVVDEFYHRLANRDSHQGDGKFTAVEFRNKFLSSIDNINSWDNTDVAVELDFSGVKKIGPSFANEAFAYFTKFAKPEVVLMKIKISNASTVQRAIIDLELETGYKSR